MLLALTLTLWLTAAPTPELLDVRQAGADHLVLGTGGLVYRWTGCSAGEGGAAAPGAEVTSPGGPRRATRAASLRARSGAGASRPLNTEAVIDALVEGLRAGA